MSVRCNYSLKFFPLVEYNRTHMSRGEFAQWMRDSFNNANKILKQIEGGSWSGASSSSSVQEKEMIPSVARFAISTEDSEVSVDSLYLGRTDLKLKMEQRFATDVVSRTTFDIFGTGQWVDFNQNENGISLGNKRIFEYKKELFDALYQEMEETAPELRLDMSPQEFSGTINLGLKAYRNYIASHENAGSKFTEYAILQNFDSLIKAKTPFITFNPNLEYDAINKYEYKGPNVEHYTGFTSSEFAAIENQDSDLAKVLLNIIPELNKNGIPIKGSFIGLSGFNSAMTSLKRALQFSNIFPQKLAETYHNGVNIDMNNILSFYIKALQNPKTPMSDEHRSFLVSKLMGIQKFIYRSNIDQNVKNMFTQMFFKTEAIQYRAYSYNFDSNTIEGSNLRLTLTNAQQYQLEDSMRGAVRLLRSNSSIKQDLKTKYNLKVSDGEIVLSSNTNTLAITYSDPRKHGKFNFKVNGKYTDEFATQAIADFLSIIVPDTYTEVGVLLSGNRFRLMDDFATPLGLVILAAYDENANIAWKNKTQHILDVFKYNSDLVDAAKKLSVIYGSDTKNVVKSPSGSNLPLYQLTNMTYNIASLLNDCKKISAGIPNAYATHLFVVNPDALVTPQVRNEVAIGDITKSPNKLSIKELLQLSTLEDFYKPLFEDGVIYLQNATFADKSTHYLIGYNTNAIKVGSQSLNEVLKAIAKNEKSSDTLLEFTRQQRKARIDRIAAKIVSDYRKVFLDADGMFIKGANDIDSNWNGRFNTINDIDEFLANATYKGKPITIDDLNYLFKQASKRLKEDIPFHEEIHAYSPKVEGRGKARINETLLNYNKIFNSKKEWKARIDRAREQFIKSIAENNWKWNKYDGGRMKEINDIYKSKLGTEWFDDVSGDIKLFVGDKLHPILEAFFTADLLLSNEYNSLTIGEVWAHPNKNKIDTNPEDSPNFDPKKEIGTYEEFSEANRLIAQIKRSVAFGATYHPFAQNQLNGVSDEIDIAVMDDMSAYVCTPNGYEDAKLDAMDGSGLADALQARFENNSLLDARVGDNKKTIMMDVDRAYGKPILLKWAVYALTNEIRRNSTVSIASAEQLCKKMRSKHLGFFNNIDKWYNEKVDKIIFVDPETGDRFKILNVGYDAQRKLYYRTLVALTDSGVETDTIINRDYIEPDPELDDMFISDSLYALDRLFGGAWTCEYDSETGWKYNEANTDMLEYILFKPEMQQVKKNAFIAYAVNKSAIKVGSGAVNKSSAFSDRTPLSTIRMRTRYGGVQMDADHELDLAEVTEMTQMISSLIENGHYPDSVNQIYSDLGRVVAKHMEKYKVNVDILAKDSITKHTPISKIISGAQTGVDTIGLEVGNKLGIETGGTIAPNFDREQGIDSHSRATLEALGVKEISSELQGNNTGAKRYLPRTEQNVINSDGTVYFATDADSAGLKATRRFAELHKKPFLLNPTAEQLSEWIVNNDIQTLNVAGNRGSKLTVEEGEEIRNILTKGIDAARSLAEQNIISEADIKYNQDLELEKEEAREKLHQLLGESLIEAFSTGSKDTLGLAQAFLNKAAEAIKNKQEFQIPFSAATINGSFISDVVSSINRGGIRHKYEGFAGVLNPSYNMVQYYKVWNKNLKRFENRMFPQLAELMRDYGFKFKSGFTFFQDWDTPLEFDADGVDVGNPFIKRVDHWSQLEFEDTVVLNYPNGKTQVKYLKTFEDIDELKAMWRKYPTLLVGLHTGRPRNLRGVETRFKVGQFEYSYYDLASVRTIFYINKLLKLINDKKDIALAWGTMKQYQQEFLNSVGITVKTPIAFLKGRIKQEQQNTQAILKAIENKKEFSGISGFSNPIIADSWYTRPAEIIMGRYQMNKFGLNHNDHIFNVVDSSFFREKLENKYNLPNEDELPSELYDIILYKGDKKFYVKVSNKANDIYSKFSGISDNPDFTINGNSVWFENSDITTPSGKQFKTYVNDYGKTFNLISVDSIDTYNDLIDSNLFDSIQVMNYTESNLNVLKQLLFETDTEADLHLNSDYTIVTEVPVADITVDQLQTDWENRKKKLISSKASNMYDSFQKSLNIVGARIPTQAMQSFMPMRVVAFTDTDKNAIYVPAAQTSLQGSDYDIDKLYIMTHSVDDNGIVSIGSKLQNRLGLNVVSKLVTPTNITYETGDWGTMVSYNEVLGVLGETYMTDEQVVDVLNRIYKGNNDVITITESPVNRSATRNINKFLKLVNSHSMSKRDVKGNALKNRIVSAITQITMAPQNQLIAQVPVDMGDPKNVADKSQLGRAEMHINSDNPETKFMMQVQNMIGKEVIGISAVSLKAFFGLTFVYNQKLQKVKNALMNNNLDGVLKTLSELVFTNPLTKEITSLSNIDIQQLNDVLSFDVFNVSFRKVPENLKEWVVEDPNKPGLKYFNLKQCISDLTTRVNRTDAALTISAIISAATDNAKELILAKINATPELVDIYTYLTAIGIPFNEIADVMVTDTLQFISKLAESTIFDSSSIKYKVKDMLAYYVGKDMPKGVKKDILINYITLEGNSGKTIVPGRDAEERTLRLINMLSNEQYVDKALTELYASLHYVIPEGDDRFIQAQEEYFISKDSSESTDRNILYEPYEREEIRNAIKFLELTKQLIQYRTASDPVEFEKTKALVDLFPNVEEMSTLGRSLGINQGMPTDLYKLRNAIKNIDAYTSDFDSFITDPEFRKDMIDTYETKTFNLPEIISSIPHFWQMIQTMYYAKQMLERFSIKNRTVLDLADQIEAANGASLYNMSEVEFRSLQNYVNDVLIATFLQQSDFEVVITPDVKLITSLTGNKDYALETRTLKLNSAVNIAAFKNWMDTYVIPMIIKDYKGNPFVDELRPLANIATRNGKQVPFTGWRFPFNLTEADKSPTTQQLYGEIIKGFNEIANQGYALFGQTIGDLFYVYNMVVNKDSFGQNSFTKIFEDMVQNNPGSIVNKYNEYISNLDDDIEAQLAVSEREAERRIVKDNPDSRLRANPGPQLDPDFVLDLQDFYELPSKNIINPNKLNIPKGMVPNYKYTFDYQAVIVEMAKQLNERLPDGQIHLITDDSLVDFKELPQYKDITQSKGFILNGEVYINVSRASGATLLHEFSHLVLAAMKANPKTREMYYELISSVSHLSEFNALAERYPNSVGSDLYEEVFSYLLELWLDNKEYYPFDYSDDEDTVKIFDIVNLNNRDAILQAVSYLLGLDSGIVNLIDIIDKPLEEILDKFGFNLLNSSVPISKAVVIDNQKQNTVKQELFKENKLNMKCDE